MEITTNKKYIINEFFDESVFTDGRNLSLFKNINTFNAADEYLLARLQQSASIATSSKLGTNTNATCVLTSRSKDKISVQLSSLDRVLDADNVDDKEGRDKLSTVGSYTARVNINPRNSCYGINIYTMVIHNKIGKSLMPFNQIAVYEGDNTTPLQIGEHVSGSIYDVGALPVFEAAVIIKYYALNHSDVAITRRLYRLIEKYFDTGRAWFNNQSVGIIQKANGELLDTSNDTIINVPNLTLVAPPIELY